MISGFLDDRFLMRLTKDESEINLASGEADPEFAEWKWTSPEEVIEQVWCRNEQGFITLYYVHLNPHSLLR